MIVSNLDWVDSAPQFATWNPADKSANITLSNGNLTSTNTGTGIVRSTLAKASGKWYWELYIDNVPSNSALLGAATSAANLNLFLGNSAGGWGYFGGGGTKWNNGTQAAYGTSYGPTSTIGVLLNMDDGELSFRLDGVSQGLAFTGLTGAVFAANGLFSVSQVIANFGASPFTDSVPGGYNPGLYA